MNFVSRKDSIMWSRAALKEHARYSINQNYWKTVLAAIILTIVLGSAAAMSSAGSAGNSLRDSSRSVPSYNVQYDGNSEYYENKGGYYEDGGNTYSVPRQQQNQPGVRRLSVLKPRMFGNPSFNGFFFGTIATGVIVFLCIFDLVLDIFIKNPLEVGCRRYFYRNLTTMADLREAAFGFDRNYSNICKTMFFRDLFTYLWTLLFIIPGIVKSYEYKMVPYLLAEYPDMTTEDAFAVSRYMMDGNKWNAFVLDLSFIPWKLLSVITFGILDIFWTNPYVYQTDAALYDAIMEQKQPFAEV